MDVEKLVLSGLFFLTLSIDGASKETYRIYRRGGDFDLVLENIKQMVNAKKKLNSYTPILEWQFLVFQHNNHERKDAEILARNVGVNSLKFAKPSQWGWDDTSILIDHTFEENSIFYHREFNKERDYFYKLLSNLNNETIEQHFSQGWSKRYRQLEEHFDNNSFGIANPTCKWLYKHIAMDATGRIIPCCITPVEHRTTLVYSNIECINKNSLNPHELFNSNSYLLSRLYFKDSGVYKMKNIRDKDRSFCPTCCATGEKLPDTTNTTPAAIKIYLDRFEILSNESKNILASW